jgi:hypothetical protein
VILIALTITKRYSLLRSFKIVLSPLSPGASLHRIEILDNRMKFLGPPSRYTKTAIVAGLTERERERERARERERKRESERERER